jgi:hypothetical protein
MPVEKIENGNWPHPARLPLGAGWSGHCTAPGREGEVPSQHILETFCNLGYAEGCAWAPRQRAWDAVRFAPAFPHEAEREDQNTNTAPAARMIHLRYVCERDHRPAEDGILEFDLMDRTWLRGHSDLRVQKMAECFLEAHLKKRAGKM